MSNNRYYFSNFIEDDTLSIIAVNAKDMLQEIDCIVKMYQKNNELLYGQSPKQILFLMKQNNKPLYSSSRSPCSGNDSCVGKSNQGQTTPVSRNSDISNFPRVLLSNSPLDDAEKKTFDSGTLQTSSPVRLQAEKKVAEYLNSTVDETGKIEEFASPVGSTGSPGTSNQDSPCSAELVMRTASLTVGEKDFPCKNKETYILNPTLDETSEVDEDFVRSINSTACPRPDNQGPPRSDKIVAMTENTIMDDKAVRIPLKIADNIYTDNHESTQSSETIRTDSLPTKEKDTSSVLSKEKGEFNTSYQGSPLSSEIIGKTSSIHHDKESRSLVAEERIDANTDSLNPGGKSGKCCNTELIDEDHINPGGKSGKCRNTELIDEGRINPGEETFKIPNPIKVGNETPSPVKRSKVCNISTVDIQEFVSPREKPRLIDSSPEHTEVFISPVQGNSPNEASQGIGIDLMKRKSPTPKRRNATIFRSIPRVVQSTGEGEMGIEVTCDSEDNPSPKISRIPSTDNSPTNTSPALSESNTDDSPKILRRLLSQSQRALPISSPRNLSRRSSSGSEDDNVFIKNNPPIVATGSRPCKSESSVTSNETDYIIFKHTALKFYTLYNLRQEVVRKIFTSLLYFQNNIGFLSHYAENVGCMMRSILLPDKQYFTRELKESVSDLTAIVSKLTKKLKTWKTDIDADVNTWNKCFERIQHLKTLFEPLQLDDGDPLITMETLQVYEHELKTIWKKMDDMIMMGDTRRCLFSQTAHDFEKMIKNFVNCLIIVGILQRR